MGVLYEVGLYINLGYIWNEVMKLDYIWSEGYIWKVDNIGSWVIYKLWWYMKCYFVVYFIKMPTKTGVESLVFEDWSLLDYDVYPILVYYKIYIIT